MTSIHLLKYFNGAAIFLNAFEFALRRVADVWQIQIPDEATGHSSLTKKIDAANRLHDRNERFRITASADDLAEKIVVLENESLTVIRLHTKHKATHLD